MMKMVVAMILGFSVASSMAMAADDCPLTELGETAADCPWASVVRTLEKMESLDSKSIDAKLKTLLPKFQSRITQEAKVARPALPLWGKSVNFDEGAKAIIIKNEIIDYLLGAFRVPPREDRVVHAGVEHTYGYLLSNLKTPYGYKRARWVGPDLEKGFGLKAGTLGPNAADGGFLSNVTYFAGSIAFRKDPASRARLSELTAVSPELKKFNYEKLKVTRLEERLTLAAGRKLTLRTDFVPFPGEKGANAEALIYSIEDVTPYDSHGREVPNEMKPIIAQLISIFPVGADFRNGALNPNNLGENQPISTRYNAYVSGITGTPQTGLRCISDGAQKDLPIEKLCH